MLAVRFRAASNYPHPSMPVCDGLTEVALLPDGATLPVLDDSKALPVANDRDASPAAADCEPLPAVDQSICALPRGGKMGPRKFAAGASLIFHASLAALFLTAANEVQIAGGNTTELAVVDVVLAPAPVPEADTPEKREIVSEPVPKPEPEPVEQPKPEPVPEPDPAETINKAVPLRPPLPPQPMETSKAPEPVEPTPAPEPEPKPSEAVQPEPDQPLAVPEPVQTAEQEVPEPPKPEAEAKAEPEQPVKPEVESEKPAEQEKPVDAEPEPTPETENAPELANVPVPAPRPEYTTPKRREVAREQPKRPERPEKTAETALRSPPREAASPSSQQAAGGAGQRQTRAGNARVSNYPGRVVSKLRRALRYPSAARRDRLRGEVHVRFTVLASGAVNGVRVTSSSGSPILDRAAIDTVRRAAPFPDIPSAAGRSSWAFTVPLAFRP